MCAQLWHPSAPRLRAKASELASPCGGGGGLPPLPLLPSLLSSLLSLPRPAREQPVHQQQTKSSSTTAEVMTGSVTWLPGARVDSYKMQYSKQHLALHRRAGCAD